MGTIKDDISFTQCDQVAQVAASNGTQTGDEEFHLDEPC